MAEQFHNLSVTLNARADLTRREADAVAKVLITAANAKTGDEVAKSLREYDKTRMQIAKERAANPLPKFPTGRCDSGSKPSVFPGQRPHSIDGLGVLDTPHVDGLGGGPVDGPAAPVRRTAGGVAGDHERQSHPDRGESASRPTGGSGADRGGSDSGGGGREPVGVAPLDGLGETVVAPVTKKVAPLVQKAAEPVVVAAAQPETDCEED